MNGGDICGGQLLLQVYAYPMLGVCCIAADTSSSLSRVPVQVCWRLAAGNPAQLIWFIPYEERVSVLTWGSTGLLETLKTFGEDAEFE